MTVKVKDLHTNEIMQFERVSSIEQTQLHKLHEKTWILDIAYFDNRMSQKVESMESIGFEIKVLGV